MKTLILSLLAALVVQAHAETYLPGDVIFQTSQTPQSKAIRLATGSKFSHVGVIDVVGNRPVVIEAHNGVEVTGLQAFIDRGENGRYAVYRNNSLTPVQQKAVAAAARSYVGRPYDKLFTFYNSAIYCSELVYLAFKKINIEVARTQKIGTLNVNNGPVQKLVEDRWTEHPLCQRAHAKNKQECWNIVLQDDIITPVRLIDGLTRVYNNYPWYSF